MQGKTNKLLFTLLKVVAIIFGISLLLTIWEVINPVVSSRISQTSFVLIVALAVIGICVEKNNNKAN